MGQPCLRRLIRCLAAWMRGRTHWWTLKQFLWIRLGKSCPKERLFFQMSSMELLINLLRISKRCYSHREGRLEIKMIIWLKIWIRISLGLTAICNHISLWRSYKLWTCRSNSWTNNLTTCSKFRNRSQIRELSPKKMAALSLKFLLRRIPNSILKTNSWSKGRQPLPQKSRLIKVDLSRTSMWLWCRMRSSPTRGWVLHNTEMAQAIRVL